MKVYSTFILFKAALSNYATYNHTNRSSVRVFEESRNVENFQNSIRNLNRESWSQKFHVFLNSQKFLLVKGSSLKVHVFVGEVAGTVVDFNAEC